MSQDDGLLTPAQRSAIEYNHYLHGIPRGERTIFCWRRRQWYWCEVIDIGRREDFELLSNKQEPVPRKEMTGGKAGGYRKQKRKGETARTIITVLDKRKQATTTQIAKQIGKSKFATYKALTRQPGLFEQKNSGAGSGVECVWGLRNGWVGHSNGGQPHERSEGAPLCSAGRVVGNCQVGDISKVS